MSEKKNENRKESPSYREQMESLPSLLRVQYQRLVEEYRYFAFVHYGQPFVSYKVLADLVRSGWRRAEGSGSTKENQDG